MRLGFSIFALVFGMASVSNTEALAQWSYSAPKPDFVKDETRPNFAKVFDRDDFDIKYPDIADSTFEKAKKDYIEKKAATDILAMRFEALTILGHLAKRKKLDALESELNRFLNDLFSLNYSGTPEQLNRLYENRIILLEWRLWLNKYKKDLNASYKDLQDLFYDVQNRGGGYYSLQTVKNIKSEIIETEKAIEIANVNAETKAHPKAMDAFKKSLPLLEKNPKAAQQFIENAIKLSPNYAPYYYARAMTKLSAKDFNGQRDDILKTLEMYKAPNVAKYYDSLGLAYVGLKDFHKAKEAFAKAAQSDLSIPEFKAHADFAEDEIEKSEYPKAWELYQNGKAAYTAGNYIDAYNNANSAIGIHGNYLNYLSLRAASTFGLELNGNNIPVGADSFKDLNFILDQQPRNIEALGYKATIAYIIGVDLEYSDTIRPGQNRNAYRMISYQSMFDFLLERPNSKEATEKMAFIEQMKHLPHHTDFSKFFNPPKVEYHYESEGKIYNSNGTVTDTKQSGTSGLSYNYEPSWSDGIAAYCRESTGKYEKSALCMAF